MVCFPTTVRQLGKRVLPVRQLLLLLSKRSIKAWELQPRTVVLLPAANVHAQLLPLPLLLQAAA